MLNYFKFNIYLTCLILGTLLASSSSSWFTAWLGLEINLMCLIPILIYKINPYSTESTIKYFIAQAMASILIIFISIFIFSKISMNSLYFLNSMIMISLAMKMGAAPFHFWLPQVIQSSNWLQILIILTWQKIAPMILMFFIKSNFLKSIIFFCCVVGVCGAINQSIIKKIFIYSSILHSGWLIASLLFSETTWLIYFLIYSLILISAISSIINSQMLSIKDIFFSQLNTFMSYCLFINFLSLAGIPPLLGFLMKLITLINLSILLFDLPMILILIMSSLIALFYYLRIMFSSFILFSKNNKISSNSFLVMNYNTLPLILSFSGNLVIPLFIIFTL